MSRTGRPIEQVVDEALQSLLDGESAEAIMARYPEHADELHPLLFAAGTLKSAPQPQLPQSSLAAMVARAQAQAARGRDHVPVIVPPIAVAPSAKAGEIERTNAPQRALKPMPAKKASWTGRLAAWLRPSGPLLRVPGALALVMVITLGIFVMSRLVNQPQPPFMPVPTVSTQFSVDGTIERMASNMWVVGGMTIYLDADTAVIGKPSIGGSAHVEGDIAADSRRVARSIVVSPGASGTMTVALASATAQPTAPAITGRVTLVPTEKPVPARNAATARPQALPSVRVIAQQNPATVQPTPVAQATGRKPPAPTIPSKVTPTLPAATDAIPTASKAQPPSQPTGTILPSRTNAPQGTETVMPQPESTATPLPQPGPLSTPTRLVPPTIAPSETPTGTPTPRPTVEPSDTPEPQPTANPDPTETPQTEDTETPRPTIGPPNTPTTLPTVPVSTVPPLASPTRSEEPHETETAEPTQGPPSTNTAQPAQTVQPTESAEPSRTVRPSETVQPTQTEQPTHTQQPEETHTAEPTDEPHGTETAELTHHAGQ